MRQLTMATAAHDKHSKLTRGAAFLAEMEQVVPWRQLCAVVAVRLTRRRRGAV
jgi:transposase, IS5 family